MTRKPEFFDSRAFKQFLTQKFREQGESVSSFAKNSDYKTQVVHMVANGVSSSPRIRRDIALYLGRKNWLELVNEYLESVNRETDPLEIENFKLQGA